MVNWPHVDSALTFSPAAAREASRANSGSGHFFDFFPHSSSGLGKVRLIVLAAEI